MVNKVESKLCETLKEVLSLHNWHIIGRFFISLQNISFLFLSYW